MASQKYNILYGRLSQEDERQRDDRQKESNSIHNQKLFLEQYAADHGFENTLFLADDGYSGTNFDRPAWKKIIEMVERDEVETIIVKDLSRLGREYLQVGQYTEIYFPEKGVRFIAVNDGVDSLVESSNDFNPIRNWANELHAKDTSKKVRAIKKMQAERGESGWAANRPTATRKRTRTPRRLSPMKKPPPLCVRSLTCAQRGKGQTRSPES
ncbi:MAG: recombinase family protein [Dysosmobacter sp.]